MVEPGAAAPDFSLIDQDGRRVSLEDLRGQTSVLVFYPLDFSPVCTDQLNVYDEVLDDLAKEGATLYGVSVDSAYCHKAFQDQIGIRIQLLADFHPKGAVAKAYGVYDEKWGNSARALVMIDPELKVKWAHRSPSALEIPGANLIFDALGA
ncbi:MAG: alkyl hydroperoxide reductase/Thiol specific antioxidant/Mal allergen [Acidobacteria bacterium]|nr:alkyl hydroperoxide reductase/Thiol specific antioxidant/Mal allergen [Acidobacteriota bacterium]